MIKTKMPVLAMIILLALSVSLVSWHLFGGFKSIIHASHLRTCNATKLPEIRASRQSNNQDVVYFGLTETSEKPDQG
jgi:hypothetical protein